MARLLLEDVTLRRDQEVVAQLRFKGGMTRELRLPLPKRSWELTQTDPEIITAIDQLLNDHTETEIAQLLNQRGLRSGRGLVFTTNIVYRLAREHHLAARDVRLRARGLLTTREIGQLIDSKHNLVHYWRYQGLLKGVRLSERNEYYYERPSPEVVQQIKQRRQMVLAEAVS